jgi:N-acetylneuraminate synthase/N,N'-diacetyllegionaminate synthase
MTIQIANKTITRDGPPFIIAEIGVNHDGNVDLARKLVDFAKTSSADAVKFQLFDADLLLSSEAKLVEYQKSAADSAYELLKNLQLSIDQLAELVAYAKSIDIPVIITPFSPQLVKPAADIGAAALKLASPDLVNRPLIEAAMSTKLPVILSTGQATLDEIKTTLGWVGSAASRMAFLHCVSAYPTLADDITLAAITVMRNKWPQMLVGYSDHVLNFISGGHAVIAGACILEKHLTYNMNAKGPDHATSLEPGHFAMYVHEARNAFQYRGPYEKKPRQAELETRTQTRQSLALTRDIPAGAILTAEMLTTKRPGTAIPAAEFQNTIGKQTTRDLTANQLLHPADITTPPKKKPSVPRT